MNRFFRTAFSTTLVYLYLTLFTVLITGVRMPFPAFSCLYLGLLLALLPGVHRKQSGKKLLLYLMGAMTAMLGFLPLALWHCPMSHYVIHSLGIAAAAAFLPLLRHRTTHERFLAKYQFTAVSLLILIGVICLATQTGSKTGGAASARAEAFSLSINNIVPYAIVLLVSGVLLLRGLRAEEGVVDEQAFNRRQLRDTLIFAILVTVVFAVDPFIYLQKAAIFLINDVLRPAAGLLSKLLTALVRLVTVHRPEQEMRSTEEGMAPGAAPVGGDDPETVLENIDFENGTPTDTLSNIFVVAAALVLLWILVRQLMRMIRNLRARSQKRGGGYPNEIREMLPQEEGAGREKKPKKRSADPRERMRYLYGEFLHYLNSLKVGFGKTDTCGEIQSHAKRRGIADQPTLSDFTALYEQARYQLEEAPAEEDARSMKELLDKIKKKT